MAAQQARIDAAAGDLANASTSGYKPTRVAFRDLVYDERRPGTGAGVALGSGAAAVGIGRSSTQGALEATEEPLDVALNGPGHLAVRSADGGRVLTRDGHLRLDAESRLVTASGLALDPPVQLPRGTRPADVVIGEDGRISVGRREVGRLTVVQVPAPNALQALGDNMLAPTQASGAPRAATGTKVVQRSLEASGTNMTTAMTDLVDAQRSYQLTSRAIQVADQAAEIANQIKR